MAIHEFTEYPPKASEDKVAYCKRLEALGFEEMWIRSALRVHFDLPLDGFGEFFEQFEIARLRHLTKLNKLSPNHTHYSMTLKVAKNLGITRERAEYWVTRFNQTGDVE